VSYFDLDVTLCRTERDEVTSEEVLAMLRKRGPMTMDDLRANLGNVRCEQTIWALIDYRIRVRPDCLLEALP
jgi:hypothetical protein